MLIKDLDSGVHGMEEFWHGVTGGTDMAWMDGVHKEFFCVFITRCISLVAVACF